MTKTLCILIAFAITSYGGVPSAAQNAAADHGPYPANYEVIVRRWIKQTFNDPYSLRDLTISKPAKGWRTGAPLFGEKAVNYGWEVLVTVNAKNTFGAYTGLQTYDLILRDGRVISDGSRDAVR
ncbi:MAG: hypothetical protein M3Y03_00080 [Verrucomicrobiota bacterium]|nr:hypothetical protein [Verrucomicrobiota bacterium]